MLIRVLGSLICAFCVFVAPALAQTKKAIAERDAFKKIAASGSAGRLVARMTASTHRLDQGDRDGVGLIAQGAWVVPQPVDLGERRVAARFPDVVVAFVVV